MPQARDLGRHLLQLRSKYGGMEMSEVWRLKALEENRKVKKLFAQSMLHVPTLKEMLRKNF